MDAELNVINAARECDESKELGFTKLLNTHFQIKGSIRFVLNGKICRCKCFNPGTRGHSSTQFQTEYTHVFTPLHPWDLDL